MKVVGMGDNVVDRYVNKQIMFPGGNAVNFAVYAKKCGMDSAYLGVLADDPEGTLIRNSLLELGVDLSACSIHQGGATERCDVVLVDGDRKFVGSGWEEQKEHRALRLDRKELEYLNGFDVIHCGCYAYMENEIAKIKELSNLHTFDFSCEEEYRTEEYLGKICPYIDMALFSGENLSWEEMQQLQETVRAFGTSYVLITKGTKGQVLFDGIREYRGEAKLITPVDTMGAGDSFFAAFVVAMLRNGWGKHKVLGEEAIQSAFAYAADFSSQNCLVEGSFGFAASY